MIEHVAAQKRRATKTRKSRKPDWDVDFIPILRRDCKLPGSPLSTWVTVLPIILSGRWKKTKSSATPKRLLIRYLLERANARLRAQIFRSAYAGYPCTASRPRSPIVPHPDGSILNNASSQASCWDSIASRNSSLVGKSNNFLTFRSFVFRPMSTRKTKNTKTIS